MGFGRWTSEVVVGTGAWQALPMIAADDKKSLRAFFRAQRAAVEPAARQTWSDAIAEHVVACPQWRGAKTVAGFVGVRGEPQTTPLLRRALEQGKTLLLPRVGQASAGTLVWHAVSNLDCLVPHRFGLLEPSSAIPPAVLSAADLILVPGLAFTSLGTRLGVGGGYYDRALGPLRTRSRPFRIGVCFASAFDARDLVLQAWDVPVHAVVTEDGIAPCGTRSPNRAVR